MEKSLLEKIEKKEVHVPDVLSCLANLSNDEIFTPPEVANMMLDQLPKELFQSKETKFLDPACKTGVFLREIAKRLLANQLPNYQEKIRLINDKKSYNESLSENDVSYLNELQATVDHIFHNQLYGIAITELTSMLSRRSVYCSTHPSGRYSISHFDQNDGNIRYKKINHDWSKSKTKCSFCGASKKKWNRTSSEESHAYEWIHVNDPEDIFKMKFDVIISNPPYQMSDGGGDGSSALPIYQKFVEQAKKLSPRYISMIIPARWYSGGKGLDDFRAEMLSDERMEIIDDFPETSDCFPNINIRGGICYFLWSNSHKGECKVINHKNGVSNSMTRPLLEKGSDTFIRYNAAVPILQKVKDLKEKTMDELVSSRLPFGIPSNFSDYVKTSDSTHNVVLYRSERSQKAEKRVFIEERYITKNLELKDKIKVLVSKASPGGDEYPHKIISSPIIAEKNSVCTETYLVVDVVETEEEARNLISYMNTRFFRFMMSLIKNTQNISKGVFAFVPAQDLSKSWSDVELYKKYSLSEDEINFIESMIKPMEND